MDSADLEDIRAQMAEIEALLGPEATADMDFRRRLTPETDRGCALSVRAYLEHRLGQLLKVTLVQNKKLHKDMFEGNGPLATFSARISVAYSIGLLTSDQLRDLNLIRTIANDFAHDPGGISFSDTGVVSRCGHLSGCAAREVRDGARLVFVTTSMMLLADITHQIASVAPFKERVVEAVGPDHWAPIKEMAGRIAESTKKA